jgi:hypothetical protein
MTVKRVAERKSEVPELTPGVAPRDMHRREKAVAQLLMSPEFIGLVGTVCLLVAALMRFLNKL